MQKALGKPKIKSMLTFSQWLFMLEEGYTTLDGRWS